MHNNSKQVTVLISSKDRKEKLKGLLMSLDSCLIPDRTEVRLTIVDNASKNAYCKVELQSCVHNLRLNLVRTELPGRSKILNEIIATDKSDYLVFLDDDIEVPNDLLLCHLAILERSEYHLVAGRVYLSDTVRTGLTEIGLTSLAEFMPTTDFVGSVIGANFSCTRKVFLEIGGFDVALGPGTQMFGDDTLFGYEYVRRYGLIPVSKGRPVIHLPDVSRVNLQSQLKFIEVSCITESYISRKLLRNNYTITIIDIIKLTILHTLSVTLRLLSPVSKGLECRYLATYKAFRIKLAYMSCSSVNVSK